MSRSVPPSAASTPRRPEIAFWIILRAVGGTSAGQSAVSSSLVATGWFAWSSR
ncbi:hypothetical protein OG943_20295 [Amycolatopsis sp. NBC_00345]|uniref:hypothetical protein n=1 Tax=Amycolatopsis sp. NBC_00345 TaxID=2975955 RepID=UPI002E255EAA